MIPRQLLMVFLAGFLGWCAAEDPAFSDEALEAHAQALRVRLPEHRVLVQRPFVVITDLDEATQARALRTVRWAADLLEKDFFPKPPDGIYNAWLFKNAESYTRTVTHLTGKAPISPYGFCASATKSIYLNYATGGGTLIHEMTHAYMHGNFPACPAWFNEGLASLFEAVEEKDGHLRGRPNWRLPGLQQALKAKTAPDFTAVMAMTSDRFYTEANGYSVARYLCYHLQERGLLIPFYRAFLANQADDKTGLASLIQVLGTDDLKPFRAEWEAATMKLELP
jgi:hypothetical protein